LPEREHDVTSPVREIRLAEDAQHPRGMAERRHRGEHVGLDIVARDEELDGLDADSPGGIDQVLALGREEPRPLPVLARREKLADEAELRVLRRADQASSAAFARSATIANAFGSETARSASDLRSSSIPDFL